MQLENALYAKYIIDGAQKAASPASMLESLLENQRRGLGPAQESRQERYGEGSNSAEAAIWEAGTRRVGFQAENRAAPYQRRAEEFGIIIDESPEDEGGALSPVWDNLELCLEKTAAGESAEDFSIFEINPSHSAFQSRLALAQTLLSRISSKGHFRLDNLALRPVWKWNDRKIGNMAALYSSVENFCDYAESLGLKISDFACEEAENLALEIEVSLSSEDLGEVFEIEMPFKASNPSLLEGTLCADKALGPDSSWVVFVPFETADFKLGGSLAAKIMAAGAGREPELADSPYFLDCYEVLREMMEDGVVKSAAVSGRGGLVSALRRLAGGRMGVEVSEENLKGIKSAEGLAGTLFADIPGLVMEIGDADFDYLDAELLLQEVAYYPLGHPSPQTEGLSISKGKGGNVGDLLLALLESKSSEGED